MNISCFIDVENQIVEFLGKCGAGEIAEGRHELDGDKLFVNVMSYSTKPFNPELLEYARSLGKPILDCQSSETCINDINEFYDQIWSQGKEEIKDDNEDE